MIHYHYDRKYKFLAIYQIFWVYILWNILLTANIISKLVFPFLSTRVIHFTEHLRQLNYKCKVVSKRFPVGRHFSFNNFNHEPLVLQFHFFHACSRNIQYSCIILQYAAFWRKFVGKKEKIARDNHQR